MSVIQQEKQTARPFPTMAAPPKGGFSLYGDLLDPSDSSKAATISSAPVLYNQDEAATEQGPKKPVDPALRFQPIRRPQVKQTKPKPSAFPKTIPKPAAVPVAPTAATAAAAAVSSVAPAKSTLADWAATEEDEWRYGLGEKRQRGGRKNKRKKQQMQVETDWDEMYDPARPTNVEEYMRSDEKIDEVREWRALLYRHRRKPDESDLSDEDEEPRHMPSNQFAPPPSHAFAPPPQSPPPAPPAAPPPDESADSAYARRLAMSTGQGPNPMSPAAAFPPPPPPPPSDSAVISQAPVRYTQPPQPENAEDDGAYSPPPAFGAGDDAEEDQTRSSRPGQAGFAQRLMSKYGWTKGTGLGADESGIVNPLRVQVEKRRRKADADGGGWAEPGGKGKIIGGKRKEEEGRFGTMSDVIVLRNMLENMPDLQTEIEQGLGQEIGEECGEKYGRVERLYIDQVNRQVFIKFTNQVSALRAVNELDGRVFNGNAISSRFYDTETFDKDGWMGRSLYTPNLHEIDESIKRILGNTSEDSQAEHSHANTNSAGSAATVIVVATTGAAGALLTSITSSVSLRVVPRALLVSVNLAVVLGIVEELAEGFDVSGRGDGNTTDNALKLGKLNPIAAEDNTTGNGLQLGETRNLTEIGVVQDGHVTNLGEDGEGNVGKLVVVDESQRLLDAGDVGGPERHKLRVALELKRVVDSLKRGSLEALDVAELNLSSSLKLVHGDLHVVAVLNNAELGVDLGKVRVEGGQSAVVVNDEAVDGDELQAAQIVKTGVTDLDRLGLGHTAGTECQGTQVRKSDELNALQVLESGECDSLELPQVGELQLALERGDGGAGDGDQFGGIGDLDALPDFLGSIENQGASEVFADGNLGIDDVATVKGWVQSRDLDLVLARLGCEFVSTS
ncbi:DNA-damage-repair/toleration protein DRT111, chloroplastic [Paramyrothecium foliicola]|nr:DNA-damage-repair/toleration protein DRT111, chloroplastic [Paramyrothecium foliicola]